MATKTITAEQSSTISLKAITNLPDKLSLKVDSFPKLNREQAGHLRHFHNLTSQQPGCWNLMDSDDPGQELFDAYRYQLATMAYATGVAHFHRLPALRGPFKALFNRIIEKMLRREVWGYWYNTSLGGKLCDPSLTELRTPWPDPVVKENIMYSGHLLLMTSLYAMLFDDDKFEQPGSITFEWDPVFWGLGAESFLYSTSALQDKIISEMERNNYLGVCCEPNVVFIICNQFPLIAIRYNDIRNGTNLIDSILAKYQSAWEKKGMMSSEGLWTSFWMAKQDFTMGSSNVASQAWTGAFMNSWNSKVIYSNFDRQLKGFVTTYNGVRLHTPSVGHRIRQLAAENVEDETNSAKTVAKAVKMTKELGPVPGIGREKLPTLGYLAQWFSELGKEELLNGILDYADKHLNPTWVDGGLYYPRNDALVNDEYDWCFVDPKTGNASIGYGRLNVQDGQKKMYENPWTSATLATKPYVEGLDFTQGVDFLRGSWEEAESALILTVRSWDGNAHSLEPKISNLSKGTWGIYLRGRLLRVELVEEQGASISVPMEIELGEDEVDLVLLRVTSDL